MPFVKGESGNPAGRPPGSRNTKTLLREAMLDAEGDDLTRQLIASAREGDRTALRLCIERVLPRGANRPIEFELPRVDSAAAARQAVADIVTAMGKGQLAPREGNEMLRAINLGAKIIATAEMARGGGAGRAAAAHRGDLGRPEREEGEMEELLEEEIPGVIRGGVRPAARSAGSGGGWHAGAGGGCPGGR